MPWNLTCKNGYRVTLGLDSSPVVACFPGMHRALGSMPRTLEEMSTWGTSCLCFTIVSKGVIMTQTIESYDLNGFFVDFMS